jgi:hypothetical protein
LATEEKEERLVKMTTRTKRVLAILALLLVLTLIFVKLSQYEIIRSYLVRWSDLDRVGPNFYVDPNMPEPQRQKVRSLIDDAKDQIATFYGEYSADPVIIAGHTMEIMKVYGGNAYNRAGRTYLTLLGSYIILGPEGARNIDIMSHELAHAELANRIGHGNRGEIPSWFDEGLAVQFDRRVPELDLKIVNAEERPEFDLSRSDAIQHDDWQAYADSKSEVRRWLSIVGQDGFQDFIAAIRSGENFRDSYRSIESTYTTE